MTLLDQLQDPNVIREAAERANADQRKTAGLTLLDQLIAECAEDPPEFNHKKEVAEYWVHRVAKSVAEAMELKKIEKYEDHPVLKEEWLDCCGSGEVMGYNQAVADLEAKRKELGLDT